MRIVLDTASFVTAVRSTDGAASEIVRMVFRREVVPLMDLKLSLEYRAVSLRTHYIVAGKSSEDKIRMLIQAFEAFAEGVDVRVKYRPLSLDPNDNMILDLAINGRSDALVSYNKRHLAFPARSFGIEVFTPAEFLQVTRKGNEHGDRNL